MVSSVRTFDMLVPFWCACWRSCVASARTLLFRVGDAVCVGLSAGTAVVARLVPNRKGRPTHTFSRTIAPRSECGAQRGIRDSLCPHCAGSCTVAAFIETGSEENFDRSVVTTQLGVPSDFLRPTK